MNISTIQEFTDMIEKNQRGECWFLRGFPTYWYTAFGFFVDGKLIQTSGHRFMWIHVLGRDAPKGMHIHHKCRNLSCVNPDHLEMLTASDHSKLHARLSIAEDAERKARFRAELSITRERE